MPVNPLAIFLLILAMVIVGWRLWRDRARARPTRPPMKQVPANLTPEAALDRLTSISRVGRERLKSLLALERRIAAEAAAGPIAVAQLAGYLDTMASAGDDIEHHVVGGTLAVRQGTFNGQITSGEGDGWRLAGRGRDLGRDHDFDSTEDLVWRGLSPSGRPGAYILALYAKGG